jgi:hypothetical protein
MDVAAMGTGEALASSGTISTDGVFVALVGRVGPV